MIIQLLINGLINGLLLSLVALGYHTIFSATKIFHIAHGAVYVAGVYFYLLTSPVVGVASAIILSCVFAFLLGILIEWSVYKPLFKKSSKDNIALISSLGVYIIIINIIALLFGNETKILESRIRENLHMGSIIITHHQQLQLFFAIPVITLFLVFVKATGYGLKIRAIYDNPILSRVVGIKIQRIRYIVFGIGSVMAVAAALLKGFDIGIDPFAGMAITLSAAVVMIVGGATSLSGTIIASLMLAIIQNFIEFYLSAQWKEPVTFAILIIVLLWRTEGILQFNMRVDEK